MVESSDKTWLTREGNGKPFQYSCLENPMNSESEIAQLCLTLCEPMNCSLPGFFVSGIFQARILEWVAISFSRGSSQPRDQPRSPEFQADTLPSEPPGKTPNSKKRQKDKTLKDELPRSVGAQYATGDQWRNNSKKNEETEPKQKQHPVAGVTGNGSKVQCYKEQYCIGTLNARIKANWKWSNRRQG